VLLVTAASAFSCSEPAAPADRSPTVAWTSPINAGNKDLEWGGTPAVGDGKVFVADGPNVTALDASNGARLWSTKVRDYDPPVTAKIVFRNGRIFFADAPDAFSAEFSSQMHLMHSR
jgi:outer membrane protein assembly factor BamB